MQKIMFNDKYGLTKAVLERKKTQTRRVINSRDCVFERLLWGKPNKQCATFNNGTIAFDVYPQYQVGEVVAIAQSYKDAKVDCDFRFAPAISKEQAKMLAGLNNKMFVKSELMQHHIKITNVRVERLQDISEEDCLAEGIYATEDPLCPQRLMYTFEGAKFLRFEPKDAYADLIDKVGKKGTWDSNSWVFVYDFELID